MKNFACRINYGYDLWEPPDVDDPWEYDTFEGEEEEEC